MVEAAFDGLRVVDFSDRLSGAWTARLFGDLGADVVLAEPSEGHALRYEPPFLDDRPGPERSLLHAYVNWNKRSRVVRGDADAAELAAGADLLVTTQVEPWPAHVAAAIAALPAAGVHLSITAHGLQGPLAAAPGNNLTACARSGWSHMTRYVDEPPLQLPVRQTGYVGGVAGFNAAAAALLRRMRGGGGLRAEVSELEAVCATTAPQGLGALFSGDPDSGLRLGRAQAPRAGLATAPGRRRSDELRRRGLGPVCGRDALPGPARPGRRPGVRPPAGPPRDRSDATAVAPCGGDRGPALR